MFQFFRARVTDPLTSYLAADSINESAKMHQEVIVAALKRFGPMGKDQIAKVSGLQANQIARRMNELQKMELIELTGKTVKSNSGRQEREWKVKDGNERISP